MFDDSQYTVTKSGGRGYGRKRPSTQTGDKARILTWMREGYHDSDTKFEVEKGGDVIVSNVDYDEAMRVIRQQ